MVLKSASIVLYFWYSSISGKPRSIASSIVGSKSFANARDIRNVYEQTVRNQFTRIAALGDLATTKEMVTLVDADVAEPNPGEVVKAKQIGFM